MELNGAWLEEVVSWLLLSRTYLIFDPILLPCSDFWPPRGILILDSLSYHKLKEMVN